MSAAFASLSCGASKLRSRSFLPILLAALSAARFAVLSVALTCAVLVCVPVTSAAARTTTAGGDEIALFAAVNASRRHAGLPPYAFRGDLVAVARAHSARMAEESNVYHDTGLPRRIRRALVVADNVGEGPSVGRIHRAFLTSPEHRRNILDHGFREIGVGIYHDDDGHLWVTEIFRTPVR